MLLEGTAGGYSLDYSVNTARGPGGAGGAGESTKRRLTNGVTSIGIPKRGNWCASGYGSTQ